MSDVEHEDEVSELPSSAAQLSELAQVDTDDTLLINPYWLVIISSAGSGVHVYFVQAHRS